jgi:hypothetical protein
MKEALNNPVAMALSVCALMAWIAASAEQAPEPPPVETAGPPVVAASYYSPYPAPCVDPTALPEEPTPTF